MEQINKTADFVIMNPPYSLAWNTEKSKYDARFANYCLAPKSKSDLAFLLDGLYRLKENGKMAILLPHGVLFRGGAEKEIRKKLIKEGKIEAIIGLPDKLFKSTAIPTVIFIFNNKKTDKDILIINASGEFEKVKANNKLRVSDIKKIVEAFRGKLEIKKFSRLVSVEEIEKNDYNLNLPRYVDVSEDIDPIDLIAVLKELEEIDQEERATRAKLYEMSKQLVSTTEDKEDENKLKKLVEYFEPKNYPDLKPIKYIAQKIEKVLDDNTGLPTLEMQQLTIDFNEALDDYISGVQKTTELEKEIKKEMLNKMFV